MCWLVCLFVRVGWDMVYINIVLGWDMDMVSNSVDNLL